MPKGRVVDIAFLGNLESPLKWITLSSALQVVPGGKRPIFIQLFNVGQLVTRKTRSHLPIKNQYQWRLIHNERVRLSPTSSLTTWTPANFLIGRSTRQTGWMKKLISLPEDSFSHDNEYFFTYGNPRNAQSWGSTVRTSKREKFITAICDLRPKKSIWIKIFRYKKRVK